MSRLSRPARELVDFARNAESLSEAGRARMRTALLKTIQTGAPDPLSDTPSGQVGSSSAVTAKSLVSTKLLLVGAITAAGGLGALQLGKKLLEPSSTLTTSVVAPHVGSEILLPVPEEPSPKGSQPTEQVDSTPAPRLKRLAKGPLVPVNDDDLTPLAAAGPDLEGEAALLVQARKELKAGEGQRCLQILATYAERYPNGILAEEHSALRVLALCEAGELARAITAGNDFLSAFPTSSLIDRVLSSCAFPDGEPVPR